MTTQSGIWNLRQVRDSLSGAAYYVPTITGVTGNLSNGPTTLVISGQNFGALQGTVQFTSGATTENVSVTPDSETQITVTVPANIYGLSAGVVVGIKWITPAGAQSGTFNKTTIAGPSIEWLLVAGGGGGASYGAGGGGGMRTSTGLDLTAATNYTVTVGAGGSAVVSASPAGQGGNTSISGSLITESPAGAGTNTIKAYGGGSGGYSEAGSSGGSGGGGGFTDFAGGTGNIPSTSPPQGASGGAGGSGSAPDYNGGGGGGGGASGQTGGAGSPNSSVAGNGGNGTSSPITGTPVTYAGGGGGAVWTSSGGTGGTGGAGGGGNGFSANPSRVASAGTVNLGGGGGATGSGGGTGMNGGSGIVILKYTDNFTISNPGGGLTISTPAAIGGFKVSSITAGTGSVRFD